MNPLFRCLLVVAALLSAPANAITRTWPGTAPCAGTLQNCIQGATDGDRIEIATNTPIAETLSIYDKNLELTAAAGYRPSLVSGQNIIISSAPISGNLSTQVSGLRLLGGYVSARYLGLGTANYSIRNMVLDRSSGGVGGYVYGEVTRGTLNLLLENNRVDCGTSMFRAYAIGIESGAGSTVNANALYNQVRCSALGGNVNYGILANIGNADAGVATGTIKLHGNEVRVEPYSGPVTGVESFTAYAVRENPATATAGNLTTRIYNNVAIGGNDAPSANAFLLMVKRGDLDAQVVNNSANGWYQSIYAGSMLAPGSGSEAVHGLIKNNLLVSRGPAFYLQDITTAALSNDYNLINAPSYGTAVGGNSLSGAARLHSASNLRLRADSPAIDMADTTLTGLGLAFAGLPLLDADGLRRIKGVGNNADIGAYEYGDMSFDHLANAANTAGNNTRIDSPVLNGAATAMAFANPNITLGPAGMSQPFGVYYFGGYWRLFDETSTLMTPGSGFNLFVPAAGTGLFEHIATAPTVSGYYTMIDNSATNDRADAIVLITQNWEPNHIYNAHPIGVLYAASRWYIDNLDVQPMAVNAGFNVYVQSPSPNAWRATVAAGNLVSGGLRVDHPLLDGRPCARPQATRVSNGTVTSNWTWIYSSGHWYILGYELLPLGTQFHIVVDPAQVAACSDLIFSHGYE